MGDKILVLKVDVNDDKDKKKALKAVTGLTGIDYVSMDMKDKKMTVVGIIDPVKVASRLRKFWPTNVLSVTPVKPPEPKKEEPKKEEAKKEEPKKEEPKKEEPKKEEPKKEEPKKEESKEAETKKEKDPNEQAAELVKMYRAYNPQMTVHYVVHSSEEDPNSCVIS